MLLLLLLRECNFPSVFFFSGVSGGDHASLLVSSFFWESASNLFLLRGYNEERRVRREEVLEMQQTLKRKCVIYYLCMLLCEPGNMVGMLECATPLEVCTKTRCRDCLLDCIGHCSAFVE